MLSATWRHRRRIELSPAERGLPGVWHLGRYNYVRAGRALPPHQHGRAMEICLLVRGRQVYEVGGRRHVLTGGDVFVTFPGEVHGTGGAPEEKGVLYWLILELPPVARPWLGLPREARGALQAALRGLPRRQFRGSWRLRAGLDGLTARLLRPPEPLDAVVLANEVVAFLLELVRNAAQPAGGGSGRAGALAPVLARIAAQVGEPLPLAALAAEAGLSLPRFKARFKAELGVPPAEYVQRARVAEAERRLRETDVSVTRLAHDLGFASSQYFATVMKRYTGRTPSALRRRAG